MGRLLARGEAVQGPVHARRAHAQTHGGEASQVHGESFLLKASLFVFSAPLFWTGSDE